MNNILKLINQLDRRGDMKKSFLTAAAIFGGLAVAFGALGAHALKEVLSEELLGSFETAVRYQMFHALVLLILSNYKELQSKFTLYTLIIGILFFSFSIYFLSLRFVLGMEWLKVLGPITPMGGLLLLSAWVSILLKAIKLKK